MKRDLRENRTPGAILLNMLIAAASLFVNGFGVYLTIQANIGAGPWDVLNIGLSRSLGMANSFRALNHPLYQGCQSVRQCQFR